MKQELLTNQDAAITTHDEESVRARAYELYEVRGRMDGHAEEDWLQAEGEVAETTNEVPSKPQPQRSRRQSLVKPDGLDDHVVQSDAQTAGGKL